MTKVRTRFAPSPTGYLHIGGARTALYSWLYARKNSGDFILRIEDTDLERSSEESVQTILTSLKWLGLDHDEGPFYQTKRLNRYREVLAKFLQEGHAYRCYCSKERLEALRAEQIIKKLKPRYDGHCRHLSQPLDKPYVIRFSNPKSGEVIVHDQVHGTVVFQNEELDDLIIARSDGMPTYNFTVVVDDWDMRITHVIRGDDHLNNTPRQINMLLALGATLPIYAHIPMILGQDGKRLSKRHGAVGVLQYRDDGYLPESLLNYLVRLGWSYGDKEIFSKEEMIELFDLHAVNKAPAAFDVEKLLWLNQHYIKTLNPNYVASHFSWHLKQQNIAANSGPNIVDVVRAQSERAKTLQEMVVKSRFFYEPICYDSGMIAKYFLPEIIPALKDLQQHLEVLPDWKASFIWQTISEGAQKAKLKLGQIAQPLRIAVTGGISSPPIDITLELLGKEKVISRLGQLLESIN